MAAGQGFKTFTTGEVLTAGDVNGYLMQGINVFASSAARAAAITSPQEGQYSFLKDTNALEYYDGAAWVGAPVGDITAVTAGTGISGGGSSGDVTITNSMATAITSKGDLVVGTGSGTFQRQAVGANGTVLTADSAEADGVKWATPAASSPTFVGCSIYNTTSFSISNNTATRITCNSEFFDTNGFHDTSTNPARITIPTGYAGKYLVNMGVTYDANGTGARVITVYKNNASFVELFTMTGGSGGNQSPKSSVVINLAVGDYIELFTTQTSGSTLTMYAREYEHPIQVTWLGA